MATKEEILKAHRIAKILEFRESKQDKITWCAQNNIKLNRFKYWLRKYGKQATIQTISSNTHREWLSVDINDSCNNLPINNTLNLKIANVIVEIKHGFDKQLLLDTIKTLGEL